MNFLPEGLRWIPFTQGDNWVLKIDADYNMVLIGELDLKYLWLLNRDLNLDEATKK